jgi:hypothetical protein
VSGLAHYFEDEGLATVVVALVREHVVSMRPPRALWVPFELGRPFGPPGNVGMQMRVLRAALTLLDQPAQEPLVVDFEAQDSTPLVDDNWRFPGKLERGSVLAEAAAVMPIWQQARARLGRTTVGISGLAPETAVEFVARYLSPDPLPNPKGMAPVSRVRFAIDDIKAFYLEAALAQGGHPSSQQLRDWFWSETLAGEMIREFQDRALASDSANLNAIASSLVPAERTLSYLREN